MESVRAVLFDLDGVIVDSREHHMAAWEAWARLYAPHAPDGYFVAMFGRRNDAIIGGVLPDLAPERFRELAARKERMFRDRARGNVEALPGVIDFLDALDERHVPKAIVTSTPRANLDLILESLRIGARFDALGMVAIGNTPAEFAAVIRTEIPYWAKVIKAIGLKVK